MKKLFLLSICFLLSMPVYAKQYIFGIVPQQSHDVLIKKWQPIADYLSKQTGSEILFKTEASIDEFEKVLYKGGYDFAYMNPYHYILANRKQSYYAELRADKRIKGILVSSGGNLEYFLNNEKTQFLFPSPNAFAATLLVKYELLMVFDVDLNKLKNYQYVGSHDTVYKGIADNQAQLGGGVQRTFTNFEKSAVKDRLEIVYETKLYPSHPLAFKPDMDRQLKDKIIDALLNLPEELISALSIKKMIRTSDGEYDCIRDVESKLEIVER